MIDYEEVVSDAEEDQPKRKTDRRSSKAAKSTKKSTDASGVRMFQVRQGVDGLDLATGTGVSSEQRQKKASLRTRSLAKRVQIDSQVAERARAVGLRTATGALQMRFTPRSVREEERAEAASQPVKRSRKGRRTMGRLLKPQAGSRGGRAGSTSTSRDGR
mmetsp:Transcript_14291/g.36523  ORF Transcript_14291/g.36523 Transcript_14291/m.36523 type:complete len:160 (-) Transcript_14291:32-511(-)